MKPPTSEKLYQFNIDQLAICKIFSLALASFQAQMI